MSEKKDEIIAKQIEVIRAMTESNLKRMSEDIWGQRKPAPSKIEQVQGSKDGKKPDSPAATDAGKGGEIDFADLYKNVLPDQPNSPDYASILQNSTIKVNPVSPVKGEDADKVNPPTAASGDGDDPTVNVIEEEPVATIEELRAELDGYIGLDNIKKEVKNLINMVTIYQKRKENDLPTVDMSLHMVFSGNPGTGKTMIARLMARIYRTLGILSKGQLVEVDRSGLVAGYVGQTALKTTKALEKAMGGVLFIDEAYTLTTKSENDFGFEAVDTILKAMEDNREDLVVIVAGYIDLMEDFIDSNPGLRSRFNKYLNFEDYADGEMFEIFEMQCKKSCYTLEDDAATALKAYFKICALRASSFGNARGVRNTFEKILTAQANRLASMETITRDDLMQITKQDIRTAAYGEDTEGRSEELFEKQALPDVPPSHTTEGNITNDNAQPKSDCDNCNDADKADDSCCECVDSDKCSDAGADENNENITED